MAKKMKTPNLNKWMNTFKNVGSAVGRASADALRESVPSISGTVDSASDMMRETRQFMARTRSQLVIQTRMLETNKTGRSARDVINGALNDIKNGDFSLGKISDDTFDSFDDNYGNDLEDVEYDKSNPDAVALHESKKNTAILGKVMVESSAASIEGMKQMTKTLASVNVKTSNAAVAKMSNIMLLGINQTNANLSGINHRLDNINSNLSAMVKYQNTTMLAANQAAVEYYDKSTQMMFEMGAVLKEMKDYNDHQREIQLKAKDKKSEFDPSFGFDFREYGKFVKNNFNNSMIGSMFGMGKMGLDMMKMSGQNPIDMALSSMMSAAMGPHLKKSLERADKAFSTAINDRLYALGDKKNSGGFLDEVIGTLFGKERPKVGKANLANFKKDAMGWNGLAQKTLVEVIPSYLSKIEAALTHQSARHFDMSSGKFMTEDQLANDFRSRYQSSMEMGMSDFGKKFNESIKKTSLSQKDADEIRESLNTMIYEQIMGTSKKNNKDFRNSVRGTMQHANMSASDMNNIMMELNAGMKKAVDSMNEMTANMANSVEGMKYTNLFNTYGDDRKDLFKSGNIFRDNKFFNGMNVDFLSEEDRKEWEKKQKQDATFKEAKKKAKEKYKRAARMKERFDRRFSGMAGKVDNAADRFYAWMNGDIDGLAGDGFVMNPVTPTRRASSRSSRNRNHSTSSSQRLMLPSSSSFDSAMNKSQNQIQSDARKINQEIKNSAKYDNRIRSKMSSAGASSRASIENEHALIAGTGQSEDSKTLKNLVLGLHADFLQPMVGGLFGKDGFFKNFWKDTAIQKGFDKLKVKLFDEKTGLFAPMVSGFKDQIDYLKYILTGNSYKDRSGKSHPNTNDSVVGHLADGYDFIFKNTMKHIFGENFEENDTFNKYFKWMDWKGKRDKKRGKDTAKVEKDPYEGLKEYQVEPNSPNLLGTSGSQLLLEAPKKLTSKSTALALRNPSSSASMNEYMSTALVESTNRVATEIETAGHQLSTNVIGQFDEQNTETIKDKANASFMSKLKKFLPKSLAAGAAGAVIGTSLGISGTGLIGSLFLPGGPIGGAMMGIGIEMLSRSKGFNKFMFGEEGTDGKKVNGLISDKAQKFIKKNMPLIVGSATLGALKGILFKGTGNVLLNSKLGFMLSSLLPGGPIGGAIMGTGLALLKNNEKIHKILFGEKDADGKKVGGIMSKSMGGFGKVLEKSSGFIKGGLKGLGKGVLTGAILSKAGLIGAAFTAGGPIGMGIAGLGLGIAAQTNRFKEILFGTEEFDEDGNSKGRMKNGLLYKVRNMLVMNVFEPIKDKISEKAVDFAYWAKDKIEYPFRLAFGPILDSMKGIKKNVSDAIHDAFNNVAKTVGDALKQGVKKVFSPFTKIMGLVGKALLGTVTLGAKTALAPLTGGLKIMQAITSPKRFKENLTRRKLMLENAGGIFSGIKSTWADEDESKYGSGLMGNIKKHIGHAKDIKEGMETATYAYNNSMEENGLNSFGWRNVFFEKRGDKAQKKNIMNNRHAWKKINALRKEIDEENNHAEIRVNDETLGKYRKKFAKLGLGTEGLQNTEDLDMLIHNRENWKDKFDPTRKGASSEYIAKHGLKIQETNAQIKARQGTEQYQSSMMSKFSEVTKLVTKIAYQEALSRKKNLSVKDVQSMNKDLKSKGIDWKDLGINPDELINLESIDEKDWAEYMRDAGYHYTPGQERKRRKGFNEFANKKFFSDEEEETSATIENEEENEDNKKMKFHGKTLTKGEYKEFSSAQMKNPSLKFETWYNEHHKATSKVSSKPRKWKVAASRGQQTSNNNGVIIEEDGTIDVTAMQNNAIVDQLQELNETSRVNQMLNAGQFSAETGMDGASINSLAKVKYGGKVYSKIKKLADKKARISSEGAESALARGLHGKPNNEDDKEKSAEAGVDGVESADKDTKKGILGKVVGFLGSTLGSIAGWFGKESTWVKFGLGTLVAGLFGDKLVGIGTKAFDIIGKYIVPQIKKGLGAIAAWWSKDGEKIVSNVTSFFINNMGTIITNGAKIAKAALTTTGKLLVNKVSKFFGLDNTPFKDVDGNTYDTEEEAAATGLQYVQNDDGSYTVVDDRSTVDEDGNIDRAGYIGDLNRGTVGHGTLNALTQTSTRNFMLKSVKGLGKAAGWVTGVIPGMRLAKNAAKVSYAAGKGVVKGTAGIVKALGNKGEQEAAEAITKDAAKKAAKGKVISKGNAAIIRSASTKGTEETVEDIGKKAAKGTIKGVEESGKDIVKKEKTVSKLTKLVVGICNKLKTVATKLTKWIPENKFTKFVKSLATKVVDKIAKTDSKLLAKVAAETSEKTAKAVGRTGAAATVFLQIGFTAFDAISGLFDAAYLFEVDKSEVDWGMRAVSSIMNTLLGLWVGPWLDILITIASMIFKVDFKKVFATKLYKFAASDEAEAALDKAQASMSIETDNYNKANKTQLSVDAYIKKKKKLDNTEQYKATDSQINAYLSKDSEESADMASVDTSSTVSQSDINAYTGDKDLLEGYGPGNRRMRSRAISYGTPMTQSDARWGNYPIGQFPDGTTSTMATGGCGPTALAMAANSLGKTSNPLSVAQYAKKNGYIADGGATSGLFTSGAKSMGLSSKTVSKNSLKDSLGNGNPVVIAGKSKSSNSPYTEAGHVIMASGIDPRTGKAIVNDPMHSQPIETDISKLEDGMTHGWSYSNKSVGNGIGYGFLDNFATPEMQTATAQQAIANRKKTKKGKTKSVDFYSKKGNFKKAQTFKENAEEGLAALGVVNKTLTSTQMVKDKITAGSVLNSDGVLNWQDPAFYDGMTVGDIRALASYDATLKSDSDASLFGEIYRKYARTSKYKDTDRLSKDAIDKLLESAKLAETLGGYGTNGTYEYKNGFPFFPISDKRWSDIKWKNGTVGENGADLASLAMVASAFGSNLLPPDYIYNHWYKEYPQWFDKTNGVNESSVFANGGYNALKSTQQDGHRVNIVATDSPTTILSALKQRKPVYMTGYKYDGSIFGGSGLPTEVDPTDKSSIGTVVGLYSSNDSVALNDPTTSTTDNAIFDAASLKDMVGEKADTKVIKSAYIVSDPSGKGLSDAIDIDSKTAPGSKYTSIKDATGIGKISAIFSNMFAVGENLLDAILGGHKYQSIKSDKLEDDVVDDGGLSSGNESVDSSAKMPVTLKKENLAGKDYIPGMPSDAYNAMKGRSSTPTKSNAIAGRSRISTMSGDATPSSSSKSKSGRSRGFGIGYGAGNKDFDLGLVGPRKFNEIKSTNDEQIDTQGTAASLDSIKGDNVMETLATKIGIIGSAGMASFMGSDDYSTALTGMLAEYGGSSSESDSGTVTGEGANIGFESTENGDGISKTVPSDYGHIHTYMGWDCIQKPKSDWKHSQYQLKAATESYDQDGFGKVGDRYAVAMKKYYGSVGDYLNITQKDGTQYKVALADIKGNENADQGPVSQYVHTNGDMVEFVVNKSLWYNTDKTVAQFHPEWCIKPGANIARIENVGNYWDNDAKKSSDKSVGAGLGRHSVGYGGNWIATVQKVKQAIAAKKVGYSQSNYIKITIDGRTETVRTDCSGFVSACCRYFGANVNTNSGGFMSANMPEMVKAGFQYAKWPGWDNLVPGDIMTNSHHIQIYAGKKSGVHYVYNCGSDSSCNNPNATTCSLVGYNNIWRPKEAGGISGIIGSQVVDAATNAATGATSDTESTAPAYQTPLEKFMNNLTSKVSSVFSSTSSVGNGPGAFFTNTLNGKITSGYGHRVTALGNEYHKGLDIGAMTGQSIYSPIDGTVVDEGSDIAGYGNYTVIQDNQGNNHLFAHMNKPTGYGVGSSISQNDIIGEVGSTGKATGSHLHYEIRKNGSKYSAIDPSSYNYKDISKNLNIRNTHATTQSDAIGSGERDITPTDISKKLNVALNAKGVETKLDTLIEVVKDWSDRDAKASKDAKSITQNTTNTTVAYGSAEQKKSSTKRTTSTKKDTQGMTLAAIHNAIAKK